MTDVIDLVAPACRLIFDPATDSVRDEHVPDQLCSIASHHRDAAGRPVAERCRVCACGMHHRPSIGHGVIETALDTAGRPPHPGNVGVEVPGADPGADAAPRVTVRTQFGGQPERPYTRDRELLRVWTDANGALQASIDLPEGLAYGIYGGEHRVVMHELLTHAKEFVDAALRGFQGVAQ